MDPSQGDRHGLCEGSRCAALLFETGETQEWALHGLRCLLYGAAGVPMVSSKTRCENVSQMKAPPGHPCLSGWSPRIVPCNRHRAVSRTCKRAPSHAKKGGGGGWQERAHTVPWAVAATHFHSHLRAAWQQSATVHSQFTLYLQPGTPQASHMPLVAANVPVNRLRAQGQSAGQRVHVCMYVCMYVHIYIYIYMYIHIHIYVL